ncbi:E3 ubiquitin-protein ligase rnf213-alpha-like [Salvelinus fontinalis]|uniref:E3 ubiquitin-protein ligase rnf213-alpha-like n=1 Tax=Salvelinus fontinalis TaxID=8038 RepID=UPI0024858ED3|nr:E3 ubiquitin-protein ligase rnf213-alpha-like [Salvelinus fontinalis]
MKCPACAHQAAKSSKFCSECGFRLAAQICTTDGTTSEHQTFVVREADPQMEDAPVTSSGNKTDAPMKHSREEPGGNVKKKSGGSSSATELSTDTRQEKDELSGSESSTPTSAVDGPPVNTATPAAPPPVNTATPAGPPPVNTATPAAPPPVNTATPAAPPPVNTTTPAAPPPVNTATPAAPPPVNTATPAAPPPVNTTTPAAPPPVNTATPAAPPPVNTATPAAPPPVNTATPAAPPPVNTATPAAPPPVNTTTPAAPPPVNTATPAAPPPVNTATPAGPPPVNTATPAGPSPVNTATPAAPPPVNTATSAGPPPVNTVTPAGPPVNTATPTGPPVNTATPAGPPTMPTASPNPSSHQTLPEDQTKGPSKVNGGAPMNEPNQLSPTSVTQASFTPETADQNIGGPASDPTQPASKLLDEEVLKGTSHGSREPSKSLDGEGNTEVRVLNERKSSSNQTDENITNEANSKKCVDQSQVSLGDQRGSDPTDEPNTSQTQPASPTPSVTQEVPEKTSKRKDQNKTEPASVPSQSVGQFPYKDALVGTSQETGDLSRRQGVGTSNHRDQSRKNEANSQNFVFGSHKAEAGDKPQESRQETSKPNKEPEKLSNTGGGDASKSSTIDAPLVGKDLPPNQRNEDSFQHQPLPPQLPPRTQQVPGSDDLTIYFHAVISKDFKLNSNDRIFLRSGSLFGSWDINGVEMSVTRDLGKDRVLVAGRMVIPDRSKIEMRSIPYKYFVYSKWNGKHFDHGTYEYIYQTNSRYIVNRCLSINQDLLTHEGEWHQYDDVIYPEPKQDVLSRITNWFQWWDNMKSTLVKGRELAGKVMLEGIFDLLRTWTEVNVRSFFSQLQQFFSTYSYPCVYDGGKTPWQLSFGEEQVRRLMKDFMEEKLDPQSQKGREKHEVFLSDPLKAGIIILIVYNKYRLKEDNRGQLSHLCQLLCLPKKPRDDFLAYWTDFTKGLPEHISVAEEVKSLCNVAREGNVVSWILVIPLLHLLRGDSKPFEPIPPTMDPPFATWAGLKGIQTKDSFRDTRGLMKVMTEQKHLVEVDHLLVRSWMCLLELGDLMSFISVIHVGVLDTLQQLQFSLKSVTSYYNDGQPVKAILSYLIEMTGQHFSDNRYGEFCLKTAVSVLGTICKDTADSDRCELPLNCLHLVSLIAETSGSSHPQPVKSKENKVLGETLRTMRDWRRKAFPDKLVNHGSYFTSKIEPEIKVWKRLISVTFGNEEFTEQWRSTFVNDFEGKLKKEKPMHQIQIYCDKVEEVGKTSPYLCNSLEKCASEAVTAICQNKSDLRELLEKRDFSKFGKLMSMIVLKSWRKNDDGQYVEGEELVMKHLLSWPMAISIFRVQGANGALINRLTDEAKERMAVASSAFCSVANKFIIGKIQIKTLNQILERKTEFTELLKIDDLCDDGRCQDRDAMKRLLRWREEEVEAIVNDKKMVDSLLKFCHKLQEHLKIDVRELQRKNQENIDQMTLDDFMEVHRLDRDSSNVTGVVTYFNLCDDTRQMASSLRAIRDSYIFTMCWENQAKELSHNQLDTDETEAKPERETEVYTLDLIHSEIFQSCNDNYTRIYESLKSGTIPLEEVDRIFEAYKDKYKDMEKDLKIMCRINSSDDGKWIKSRVQQIQQYHDLHLALESAKVIMDVRETVCPQGDFKVLQTLLDMNTEDFKEESLNRIDDNLLEIKKDLEDITEPRRQCLRELGLRRNFVKWVKEALEDINELKVFVDLASISAGENDLDVDRVACFHDAVLGYSSMLYGLPPDADFHAFKDALTKLWKALGNDSNIPNKLRDTARHLEWLKTVKDSHGSVELSSLSLAKSINTRGIYIISAQNQKKLCLDTALKLQIPEQQEEDQMRNYSLEDLRDLQNKLMLMSGKGEQSQIEVDHFTEVFDSVQRLAVAFVDLYAAGNPLFRCWEARIHCNTQSDTGIVMEFNLGNILQTIKVEGNAMDHLTDLCRKIEVCLDDWNRFMDKQRSQHYYLNYYTAEQIVYLCSVLTEKNLNTKLDEKVLMMLSFIKPECSVSDVWETWIPFQNNMTETEQDDDTRFQTFIDLHNDMEDFDSSFADEGKCAIDVLQSLLDQAVGLRKLDLVWDAYMKDMRSILQDSLDTRSFGILLEMLANKENQEEDDEEPMFLEPSENTVRRKLPKGLFNCQPNLIICPQDEILTSSICLYMTSDYEQLPTYDEVLLCTPVTSYEQVELFFRRCLTPGYLGEKIYTLLFADQLSYEVSYAVEKLFQKLSSCFRSNYRLVIICSAEREHTYIPSAFSQFKRNMVPQESLERIQRYLSRHYTVPSHQTSAASVFKGRHFVGIVSSQRAGVGKSLYIQRLYEKLEGTVTMGTTFRKCIRLIEPKVDEHIILQSLFETPESKEHKVFHFDVTSSVQKGLHEFLFKLFFLRYLTDSDGLMWKCSNKHLYVIETLLSTNEPLRHASRSDPKGHFPLFEVFPKVFCRPPKEVMGLEARNGDDPVLDTEDPLMDDQCFRSETFQRPYQYLTRFHRGENLDSFNYQRVEGTHAECLQMLFIYCGIIDPSWAELKNFAGFLNLQLLDCETSDFCNFEFVGDTLRGFRNFVVDFMILMAKDFATPSLCIADQSHGRQPMDTGLNERDLAPFLIRKRWESEPHPYIFFNDDHVSMTFIGFHLRLNEQNGVDAINPLTNAVIKRNIMTKNLYNGLRHQRVPFNIDFDQLSRADKIERLCSVLGTKWPTDPDETYELTTDNILKMMAIHMRFRCGIPVIIMGETGCGKTRLIKFLCELRRSGAPTENMKLVKVHGGTTSDMIYNKVREAEKIAVANKEKHDFDSVLFFDEANTTEAISSIKEILCDNTVQGQQLSSQTGLQIIAACNPYRKHTDEMIKRLEEAGLGYRVRAEETEERLGSIPLRQLVYRVQVLPPSMIPLVWDFGQLSDHTEKMYIQQIVQRVVETNSINRGSIRMITDVLSSSQGFMRERKDECSFVSLRDVERCMQVFVWFYNNHSLFQDELKAFLQKQPQEERSRSDQLHSPASDPVVWSLLMAVGVCYQACLKTKGEYQTAICNFLPEVIPKQMKQEISVMQDLLLSGVPMGETIARNKALKENVFMMVICIELRIPLFLVGKPGSSKSLSKTLVADAMQGQAAHSELYKRLKQVHLVSFQCSPHSTPEGIINTFRQCARFQESKNLEEYISVVVLDEIGLAEDSPKMPLKTLHPLLEEGCIDDEPLPHKRVGFIGISNWALDPAKMNRGLFVSRGDPDQNELLESAKGICSSDKMILEKVRHLFTPFSQAYMTTCKKGKGFFGLRDYYSLVKMMFAITKASKQSPSTGKIIEAVLRNFSGRDDVDAVRIFTKELPGKFNQPDLDGISTIDLVKQNIVSIYQDEECRYLLVLTKNYAALQILQQTFFSENNHPEIIFGSSFPKDQEYTQICRNINRVKICMETGQTVVLLNLQNLYESLYDALNQYYVSLGGQKYVDLGLGTHRVKCRVHKDFRLIVIEEKEVVYKQFPIPLINRLEKHYLDINTVLKKDQKEIVEQLKEWVKHFVSLKSQQSKTDRYKPHDVFIGYHSDTCPSVVLQVTEKMKTESDESDTQRRVLDEAKLIMLNCATPDSVIRLDGTKLSDDETENLTQIYFEEQNHHSLADFIASHTQEEEWMHYYFTEVTTFSRLLTAADIHQLQNITERCDVKLLSLQQFDTEHSFLKEIRQFLDSTSADKVLIIQTDYDEDSQSMNILASAKYSSINEINKSKEGDNGRVFVYFVTKLPRIKGGTSYVGFHGGPWKSVHIDDLRKSKEFVSDVQSLRKLPISQLFEKIEEPSEAMQTDDTYIETHGVEHSAEFDATDLMRSCVQSAVSMLRDQEDSGALSTRRVEILLTLLDDSEDLKATFLTTLRSRLHSLLENRERNIPSPKYWVLTEASNIDALQEGGTFTQTLWKKIQAVVTPLLAQLVSVIDRDCNLDLLLDSNSGEEVRNLWLKIFGSNEMLDIPNVDLNSESKTILVQSHVTAERTMCCAMPFSWRIRDILDELLIQTQQTRGRVEVFFEKIPLGQYLATLGEKLQREFFQRYLQDFVAMTMKVASEAELKHLCEALSCCVNELQRRRKAPSEEIPSLPLIHTAYNMYRTRLHNLTRMMSLQPQVVHHLQRIPLVKDSPEMVLDVYAAVACVELLEPPALDSDAQCQDWLKQVKRLKGSMELVCSQRSLKQYGERSRELFDYICNHWNRICIVFLFVEHMLLGFESEERELKSLVLDHTRTLGKILAKNSDVKSEEPFAAIITVLKTCKQKASDLICKFGFQCRVCMGEPQDPVDLPCHHIFCLTCVRGCLNTGQMYCPMCKHELPDDFQVKVSEDIRACITLNAQFRQSCNAFFIDLVTTVCFKDNIPPSKGVILHLLSFLMVETEPIPLIRAQSQIHTKDFSPFDESMDKNPVVRSVILKLLLKYTFDEVKEYLQQYLTLIEESNILEAEDKNELYALYINCLEDSMFDRKPHECQKPADQQAYLQKETEFLSHFLDSVTASAETVTIEYLQQIARVRLCLDTAAHLLHSTQSGECEDPQDVVEEFLCAVRRLCKESKNDWYRVYLIRNISSQQGVEYVQRMLKDTEKYGWLFPEEVQQQNEDVGQMDQYLIYGEDYQDIREAVAKAVLEDSVQEIEDTCQRCTAPARRRTLYILLALFREVTSLYRAANTGLHPTLKQCKALEDFIEGSRYLNRREVRDFAKELVHNRMGGLSVLADRSSVEHTLIELAVHMSAVLLTGTEGLLTPLQQLGLSPNNMLSAFLPTMPEDMLAVAQRLITQNEVDYGLSWYSCPNGHPCVVDKCGQPTHKAKCLECGAEIGGENHVPLTGFQKMEIQQGDLTRTGHILGDPQRRDNPDTMDTKNMSLTPFILVRLLTHLAMLRGASEQPQFIQQIIQPPVQDACEFLICHLLKDMDQLTKALGKGTDDTVTTVHLIVRSILEPPPTNHLPAGNDPQLSTKEARNTWETTVATDIITPQLKNLDQQLREVNATIRDDSRVSSNFVMRVTFGDECPLSSLPQGSQVHCSGVWSCRERVSLLSLTHIVEQNDGKDKLPLLWRFLQKEAEFRLVKFLPDILVLQKSLVNKFQNSSDLMDVSIREFIQRQSGPMRVWYEKRVQIFLNTWNLLRVSVAINEIKIPEDFWKEDLDLDSDLHYLLPRRQGPGLCSTALLSHLVALHNELLHSVDRHTGEDTSYKVSLSELTELHVIRYELEKDLLPLVLSNCQYSLERGKETLSEYDLPKIQQQVLTRFLQGKPLITLTGIPTLVTRHERDYDIIFKMVKGNVSQEHLPSLTLTALSRDLQSYSEVCEALKAVELALGFLSMTGGDSQMPLVCYLENMLKMGEQMDSNILKALGRCSLKHCVALWQLLSSLKSENMLKSLKRDPFSGVSAEYQQPLEEEQKRLLQGFISKGHVDTWLLEMHEFLLLNLGKPHVSDTYKPNWSVKETLAGYMDRKEVEVLPDVVASFPDEIRLSQIVETWKFTVTSQQEWMM